MYKTILLNISSTLFLLINKIFKNKNKNKNKILIFTDSRGIEITKIFNRRNPFSSYIGYFIKKYNTDFVIMPESHTTLVDFLYEWHTEYKNNNYSLVILHVGIVDFSPRPESMLNSIRKLKNNKVQKLFFNSFDNLDPLILSNFIYNNELTSSMYTLNFLRKYILRELKLIDNLIYIGSNKILDNWSGNYSKERPKNINEIIKYDSLILDTLENSIDIRKWTEEEIKKYTVDNIHLSIEGFRYLENELEIKLQGLTCETK